MWRCDKEPDDMIYPNTHTGIFQSRPNRFIAHVELDGQMVVAHVKNTGRCRELLIPGVRVVLQKASNPDRKTEYDLIAVWKGCGLINMDSQAPNKIFLEYLQTDRYIKGVTLIKPEARYGSSRFDFYVEAGRRKIFIETKGVTLEADGTVLFPDAPTQRGVKHVRELAGCIGEGYEAHIVFVVQMSGVRYFTPNNKTHPAFGNALIAAEKAGVQITALDCSVTENSLAIGKAVPVLLTDKALSAAKAMNIYEYQRPLGKIEDIPEFRDAFIVEYAAGDNAGINDIMKKKRLEISTASEKLLTDAKIKKATQEMTRDELSILVTDIAGACPQAREYLTLRFASGGKEEILEKYKLYVEYEF
jgi:sugar fermentation stimulation protein A